MVHTFHRRTQDGVPEEHRREQLATEAADKVWAQHIKPSLLKAFEDEIIEQAIAYTHTEHLTEVPFEDGRESRERLRRLVADAITFKKK